MRGLLLWPAAEEGVAASEGAGSADTSPVDATADPMMLDDDALLQQALALSMGQRPSAEIADAATATAEDDDDAELRAALAMSLRDHTDRADRDDADA